MGALDSRVSPSAVAGPDRHSCGGRARGRPLAIAAGIVCLLIAAATAQAQDDPYATVEEQAKTSQIDTDLTPVAKETDLWTLVHGAPYPNTETIDGSVTRFDTDLFAVSFQNRTIGLAGGSECAAEPIQQKGEDDAVFGERVANCEGTDNSQLPRVPVLYRYDEPATEDPGWDRLSLPGSATPGYIAAITWIDSERALIVGGTGAYPRREPPADGKAPTDPTKADETGKARAWVYYRNSDRVEELDLSEFTADTPATDDTPARAGMRGLTAADCYEDPNPQFGEKTLELCFAGGLGQVWEWRDGKFNGERIDAKSPPADVNNPQHLAYRVREIEFSTLEPPMAVAVTAGCCASTTLDDKPRILVYTGATNICSPGCTRTGPPRWFAGIRDRPELPDSFYSLTLAPVESHVGNVPVSLIASPGGKESAGERSSVISGTYSQSHNTVNPNPLDLRNTPQEAARTPLSTARLVAGDGDVASSDPNRPAGLNPAGGIASSGGDGVPDWAVGELRSTDRAGLGARGLVVATALAPRAADAVNASAGLRNTEFGFIGASVPEVTRPTPEEIVSGWEPIDQEKLDAHVRSQHYMLPSYSANAIDLVGAQEDGWAVGDHGAILRLSSGALQAAEGAAEPEPPRLGGARQESLSDRSPYDSRVSIPTSSGVVPAYGGDTDALEEPEMVLSGSPGGSVTEIAMSRDGSEGWAIGSDSGGAIFYRFDGATWSRCDPLGIKGLIDPDPACAAMAPLRGWRNASGSLLTVSLEHAARVPLENDNDPTNDDELEIIAVSDTKYQGPETGGELLPTVVRYRNGRWHFEHPDVVRALNSAVPTVGGGSGTGTKEVVDIAFSGPDDGWLVAGYGTAGGARLYHFDGERWLECAPDLPERCGDTEGRVPARLIEIAGLAAAGDRVYLYGARSQGCSSVTPNCPSRRAPLILYHDRGRVWTDGSRAGEDGAGLDPAFSGDVSEGGEVNALSVIARSDGDFEGWAFGRFGSQSFGGVGQSAGTVASNQPSAVLLRLNPDEGRGWRQFRSPGPLEDYMMAPLVGKSTDSAGATPRLLVGYPSGAHSDKFFIGQEVPGLGDGGENTGGHIFGFDSAQARFELLDSGRPRGPRGLADGRPAGRLTAMAPDGEGGFWAAVSGHFFHYTDHPPKAVFAEAASPAGIRGVDLRDLSGGPDGSTWIATDSDRLYRHDRVAGWEEVRIPGWDPGRVVTRSSSVNAIAIGPGGQGLAVGEDGRIAAVSRERVGLDIAAGRSCALGDAAPCSTGHDLRAVDLAPDGSAIAGGERMALLWRPAGGGFRRIKGPRIASATTIEAVAHPLPSRAYLATDRGIVFRGDLVGEDWEWQAENMDDRGEPLSAGATGKPLPIHDVAIDSSGHGYAVGEQGLILERGRSGSWRRIASPHPGDLTVVALPEVQGDGALIGGRDGIVLTEGISGFTVAQPAGFTANQHGLMGAVVGFALLPGPTAGSVDAWAAVKTAKPWGDRDDRLLRYSTDPDAPLAALPDAPLHGDRDLALAAFGKSDCETPEESEFCEEFSATTTTNEYISGRIVDELSSQWADGELSLAIQTGDAVDSAGLPGSSVGNYDRTPGTGLVTFGKIETAGQRKHRRWVDRVANEFEDKGIPLFATIGGQDLTEAWACDYAASGDCRHTRSVAVAGENFAWREAFAGQAEPWGDGSNGPPTQDESGITFEPAPGSEDNSIRVEDQGADVDGDEGAAAETKAEIGGANTHYAVDAVRDGDAIARTVFVDTSLRSLQASDPLQQPHEIGGGQQRFLERMICKEGSSSTFGDMCTRGKDQRAIVVSNTPTYSYGPGALTHTALDATTFEATMLRYDVDLVISGALGYNGLYYTLAPGVHEPCPAGQYPEAPPSGSTPDCLAGPTGPADEATKHAPADPAALIEEQGLSGAYPTLIASGAGGKFGPDGNEPPDGPAGQWHGYSMARLLENGDLVVEQRPILDWIGMDASDHVVAPKSRLKLRGYGRSPISTTTYGQAARAFHYAISTPAITHRYDLLLANPDEPWLPCEEQDINCQELHANLAKPNAEAEATPTATGKDNPCSPYLCLPSRIGVVDDQSGQVRAGDGKYPETFAIAMLSVDEEVATYPLVFKRSPAFVATPALRSGTLPNTAGTRPTAPPPPPPPPGLPQIPQVDVPQIPPPPGIPQLSAATPPELQPPAPPAPPPPSQQPAPLDLSVAPPGVSISTPTALIQPPTPPVNPAPPGGARREARQRQAAAQKGGADSSDEGAQDGAGDLAQNPQSPTGTEMTRLENHYRGLRRGRPEPSFTAYRPRADSSPVGTGLLYAGGLTLLAFALAAGWRHGHPTPRRGEPELPAAATAWSRDRYR